MRHQVGSTRPGSRATNVASNQRPGEGGTT
jgi:hypothetical protein